MILGDGNGARANQEILEMFRNEFIYWIKQNKNKKTLQIIFDEFPYSMKNNNLQRQAHNF